MTRCLACGAEAVQPFLALGRMALANRFLSADELDEEEPQYPLTLGFCHGCAHVQLTEPVPPAEMFSRYLYVSSASETLTQHFGDLARMAVERFHLSADDLVVDIGCNDGTLLGAFQREGTRVLGVDPAVNLREYSARLGVEVYADYFGARAAPKLVERYGRASLITMTNTVPHVPDLPDFAQGLDILLAPGGTLLLEFHYLADFLAQCAFDTIYHEHCSYWALRPLQRFVERHGFRVVDVERLPIHHGQLRVLVQRAREADPPRARVKELAGFESAQRFDRLETFQAFARQAYVIREQLNAFLDELVGHGRLVVGYGAPAKASTLLNFVGIGPDRLRYIVDHSVLKQGRYMPGTHIPIVPTERLLDDQPDVVLLLAWNFADEIRRQQAEYLRRGGRFVVPVPAVTVVA